MSFDCPVFLNVRDRLTPLKQMVEWLEEAGHEHIVFLDNASTYEPLLAYLAETPHRVERLQENLGARALWDAHLAPSLGFYVFSDPDIVPIGACPHNLVEHLRDWLVRRPDFPKAGPGLYLDDLPEDCPHLEWERSLVSEDKQIAPGVFRSMIDTTFALYRPGARFTYEALRMGFPYQARHLSPSWYGGELSEEDSYYLAHARKDPCLGSSWAAAA